MSMYILLIDILYSCSVYLFNMSEVRKKFFLKTQSQNLVWSAHSHSSKLYMRLIETLGSVM